VRERKNGLHECMIEYRVLKVCVCLLKREIERECVRACACVCVCVCVCVKRSERVYT
jgi:hypothetical protein